MAIEMAASSNLHDIDDEISAIDAQIEELNRRKRELVSERQRLREKEKQRAKQRILLPKLKKKPMLKQRLKQTWKGWKDLEECLKAQTKYTPLHHLHTVSKPLQNHQN